MIRTRLRGEGFHFEESSLKDLSAMYLFKQKKFSCYQVEFLAFIRGLEQKHKVRNVISRNDLCVGKLLGGIRKTVL